MDMRTFFMSSVMLISLSCVSASSWAFRLVRENNGDEKMLSPIYTIADRATHFWYALITVCFVCLNPLEGQDVH